MTQDLAIPTEFAKIALFFAFIDFHEDAGMRGDVNEVPALVSVSGHVERELLLGGQDQVVRDSLRPKAGGLFAGQEGLCTNVNPGIR